MLFQTGQSAFFVYGFPKSARDNVRKDELQGFKELANEMFAYDDAALAKAMRTGALSEVRDDEIRGLRERERVSQAVFARHLNVTTGLISQ